MSKHMIFSVLLLTPLISATSAFAQSTCRPNYQTNRVACGSGEIIGYTTVVDQHVRVNAGACKVPDAMSLCREFIDTFQRNNPGAERIEASNPTTDGINQMCGDLTHLRQKVDVFCDFTYQKPEHRKVIDAICPIESVTDLNGCAEHSLGNEAVSDCLNLKVASKDDLWVKGACLHNINEAALNIDISRADFERVQTQLEILRNRIAGASEFDQLNRLLQSK